jgi:hypothetical protein
VAPTPSGMSDAAALCCADSTNAISLQRAVWRRCPRVKAFHRFRASAVYHGQGRALDCMISCSTVGSDIPDASPRHRQELGRERGHLSAVHLDCTAELGGPRSMSERHSPIANDMDHVHVSVYSNSGTV